MEIQPDDYQSPLFLTSVFQSLGRPEEAAKYARLGVKRAEEALRLHPESSKPAQQGACALAILGERERAKEWLARALAIDPDDNLARYNAACTYSLLGEIDRSIDRNRGKFPGGGGLQAGAFMIHALRGSITE